MSNIKTVVTADELRARLDRLPRLSLADLPTPLLDCPRLSKALDGPHVSSLNGKIRPGWRLEETRSESSSTQSLPAVEEGYDVLLHGAASQSNQSRLTAAVAARLGLKAVMVGRKDARAEPVNGNLLLSHLFGAEVNLIETAEEREAILERLRIRRKAGLQYQQRWLLPAKRIIRGRFPRTMGSASRPKHPTRRTLCLFRRTYSRGIGRWGKGIGNPTTDCRN